jgi:outer membrane protein
VEKLKVDQAFLDAAKTRADIARTKYNNGLMTFENWDIIENDLIQRQKSFLQSQRDRVVAEAAWEQAQGKGVIP